MIKDNADSEHRQSFLTEEFFYFFLRLRKGRIRQVAWEIRSRFPDETPEQQARRLIAAQSQLSFLGGAIMHLPMLIPGLGETLKLLGVVGGGACLTRMHLYLILEIALLFGKDIEDSARVPEMAAVVAATGLAVGAPFLVNALDLNPLLALPAAGLSASTASQLIGEAAIRFYREALETEAATVALPPDTGG
ncbi:MAG: hypothetical protein ACOZFS_14060 [Thermodesulfobacteriota bacterium]